MIAVTQLNPSRISHMEAINILKTLSTTPTVSYFERGIAALISKSANEFGLTTASDEYGNLFVHHPDTDLPHAKAAFVAHMDHPGFEIVERLSDREYVAVSHGGMAPAAFKPGVKIEAVKSVSEQTPWERIPGVVTGADDIVDRGRFASCTKIQVQTSAPLNQLPTPAVLDLPDFDLRDGMIFGRALYDLAGCAAILYALHSTIDRPAPCVGIFTRAEEIGLVGARLIAESGIIPRDCMVVSVETSLKNEVAKQGNGVVIRVGDIITTFDNEAENLLLSGIRESSHEITHQRALMSAGGCEASAFAAHGYRVTGTSLPLGAWHNREEDGSIAPEYVAESDFNSGVMLLVAAIEGIERTSIRSTSSSLTKHPKDEGQRLARDAAEWTKHPPLTS